MKENLKCPRCGSALPGNAPEGLCPRCLGALNLGTETALTGEEEAATQAPMEPAELGRHFPQLEILEYLGRGGMGVVYKARQKSLNRLVALKLLAPERVQDARFAERFAREAQALAQLNHPNIVTIYDFGQAGGFYFLLMEFVDGVNLRQLLRERKLQPAEALAIVPPICEALQYAHDHGIVHRDIKPENLLLDKNGRAKIADFGIAKMMGAEASQVGVAETQVMGTPQYMAPEQRSEPQSADHRADIYSLGVVLYELLTGELPADKLQPPSRKVQIDVRLDEIVLRALQKTPELRYQTAAEFRTQVETVISEGGPLPRGTGAENTPGRMIKVGMTTVTTPERLASFAGQLFHYRTKSHLILDDRQLTFSRAGSITNIPLASIRDLSIGRYPGIMNPAGINFISVTYTDGAETRRLFFTPNEGLFGVPSQFNQLVAEWFEAIRTATTAATGRAPATTPANELGVPSRSIALLALFAALAVPGGLFGILLLRGSSGRLGWPELVLLGVFGLALLSPFLLGILGRRRPASTAGKSSALRIVFVVLAVIGGCIAMGILVVGLWISLYMSRQAPRVEAQAPPARVKLSPDEERAARVKLNQAATHLERVRELYAQKLVSEQELNLAKFQADLRRAELLGDAQQAARIRLAYAEEEFKRASELRKQNLISESEYNEKKNALELEQAIALGDGVGIHNNE